MAGKFRNDVLLLENVDTNQLTETEWKKYCPEYGSGYTKLSGMYCDHCRYLYDENKKVCPNNK